MQQAHFTRCWRRNRECTYHRIRKQSNLLHGIGYSLTTGEQLWTHNLSLDEYTAARAYGEGVSLVLTLMAGFGLAMMQTQETNCGQVTKQTIHGEHTGSQH